MCFRGGSCCGAFACGAREKTRGSNSVVPSVESLVADLAEEENKAEEGRRIFPRVTLMRSELKPRSS